MSTTNYENATYLFPDSGETTRVTLFKIFRYSQIIAHLSIQSEFFIAIFGVILTFFHFLVLCRKSMMTSSVILIMIGVAIFDIISMVITIKAKSMMFGTEGTDCNPPATLLEFRIFWFFIAIRDLVHRSSTWLGVLMALIRFCGMRFAMNKTFFQVSKPIFGIYAIVASLMPSLVLSTFYWLRYEFIERGTWSPSVNCTDIDVNKIEPVIEQKPSELFTQNGGIVGKVFMLINGLISKIVPCILLPLLTALLILELRTASESRKKMSSGEKDKITERTTAFVIFMAISFFVAELPIGTALALQVAYTDIGFLYLATYVTHVCNALFTINSITHCLVFFAMSSQYREIIKKALRISKE